MHNSDDEDFGMAENQQSQAGGEVRFVNAGRIAKLPKFWKEEPDLWFAQVEAAFRVAHITTDLTKYDYLITNLDAQVLPFVSDIIRDPPAQGKYEAVKSRILTAFAETPERKLRRVLKGQLLGDQKPSHFLQHIKNLAAGQCSEAILQSLFLEQMPEQLRGILAVSQDTDLTSLAALADKVMELQGSAQVCPIAKETDSQTSQELTKSIQALTKRLDRMNQPRRSHGDRRRRSRSGHSGQRCLIGGEKDHERTNSKDHAPGKGKRRPFCTYHYRFGMQARNCVQPCQWPQPAEPQDSTQQEN